MKNFIKAIAVITLIATLLSTVALADETVAADAAPVVETPVESTVVEKEKVEAPSPVVDEEKVEEPAPVIEEKEAEEPAPVIEEKEADESESVVVEEIIEEQPVQETIEETVEDQPVQETIEEVIEEQPTAEPSSESTVEPTAEETAEPTVAPTAEPAPAIEEKAEETVTFEGTVEIEMENDEVFYGDKVTLKARVANPNGASYKLQWQVDKGGDWKDIAGETRDEYEFEVTEENAEYAYRVVVIG